MPPWFHPGVSIFQVLRGRACAWHGNGLVDLPEPEPEPEWLMAVHTVNLGCLYTRLGSIKDVAKARFVSWL